MQLRNLLWATSPHDLFVVNSHAVCHWSSVTRANTEVLNLRGLPKGPRLPGIGCVQVGVRGGVFACFTCVRQGLSCNRC